MEGIISLKDIPLLIIIMLGVLVPTLCKYFGWTIKLKNRVANRLINALIDAFIFVLACFAAGVFARRVYHTDFGTYFIRAVIVIGMFDLYLQSRLDALFAKPSNGSNRGDSRP